MRFYKLKIKMISSKSLKSDNFLIRLAGLGSIDFLDFISSITFYWLRQIWFSYF